MSEPRILYCHCAFAKIIQNGVKREVLDRLAASGRPFEAVPDLCELVARRDPRLGELAGGGPVKIAACFPRAVRWLFSSAGHPLPEEGVEIHNMRETEAADVAAALLGEPAEPVAEEAP